MHKDWHLRDVSSRLPTAQEVGDFVGELVEQEYGTSQEKGPSRREGPLKKKASRFLGGQEGDPGNRQVGGKKTKLAIALEFVTSFGKRYAFDHVGAFAAAAAYFLIMSFIPFVMFLSTIIRYTDLSYSLVSETIRNMVPSTVQPFVEEVVREVYHRSTAILPVSMVLTLWSAGKAIQSLMNGLNSIYHVRETRNWLMNRVYSVFYTVIMEVAIISSFVILVIGGQLNAQLVALLPFLKVFSGLAGLVFFLMRSLVTFIILFFAFSFMYLVLPNRPTQWSKQAPGALIVAVAWTVFSNLFALYFEIFPAATNMYGSMSALILVMMFVYFFMTFLLAGAVINVCFEEYLTKASYWIWQTVQEKREKRLRKKHGGEGPFLTDPEAEGRFSYPPEGSFGEKGGKVPGDSGNSDQKSEHQKVEAQKVEKKVDL